MQNIDDIFREIVNKGHKEVEVTQQERDDINYFLMRNGFGQDKYMGVKLTKHIT